MVLLPGCRGEWLGGDMPRIHRAAPRATRERGYSATTTTAAARGAAQIDCATLGEHKLKAGEHDEQPTQCRGVQANSGSSADRSAAAVGTPAAR
ncbi:hypothetical protein DQP56_11655 [Mycolicibacter senuensis]|nr:hypothetical protein DQP56_11655 [Mycolicibacter senuensis]